MRVYVSTYVCTYVCTYVSMCVYIYMYVGIYSVHIFYKWIDKNTGGRERERDREFGVQPTMPDRFMPEQSWLFGDEALYGLAAPQMQFF